MQQVQAHVEDLRLDTERRLTCIGSALVRFEYLNWNVYIRRNKSKKRPDPERVERVKRIFRREGCLPRHVEHHIPAVIDQRQLNAALEDARRKGRWKGNTLPSNYATINSQDGYPELEFPGGIECLRGRHRIEAGKVWLPPTEKWWIVDLYLSGISYELETLLVEEYANEEKPCDGEIYRKIREYQCLPGQANSQVSPITCVSLEMRWWARFNQNREKRLRGLLRNRMLTAGFDALSKIPGLFDAGMMITTLHTVLATRCYEEIQCYLQYTGTAWDGFLKGVERGLPRVDTATVKDVELRAPAASTLDAEYLRGKILGGAIFSGFSTQERAVICENVLAFKGVIPSLFTFFQDMHLLQACVESFKLLVTVGSDQTLYTALGRGYANRRQTERAQTSETTFRSQTASPGDCLRLGYLQLFAFALRNYKHLSKPPAKGNVKEMPRARADPEAIQQFAVLSAQLGFNSPEIDALTRASGPLPLPGTGTQEPIPILVTTGPGERIKHRHGLPRINTFKEDRKYLFLHNLCEERDDVGEGITSFFVLKSWFIAFFDPPRGLTRAGLSAESLSPELSLVAYQQAHEEDVSMGEGRLGIPNQREVEQQPEPFIQEQELEMLDTDAQIQETVAQIINEPSIEASATLQEEEDTLFVPTESTTQRHTDEARTIMKIRFVCREGKKSESEMFDPFRGYSNQRVMQIYHADLASRIVEVVDKYLNIHMRACDKYKRYIPIEECYNVVTRAENNYTLFFIPDEEYKRKGQSLEVLEREMEWWSDYEIHQEIEQEQEVEQNLEGDLQVTDALEELHHEEVIPDAALLGNEKDNAANAHILDRDNTIIYLKKRVGDSHDVSKPAEDWSWVDVQSMDVPIGDPQDIVGRTLRRIWQEAHLKPHDKNLRTLEYGDCYKVAAEADDHTLYLMVPSPQTEEERAAEHTWVSPLPLPAGIFDFQEKLGRKQVHTTLQSQEDAGFRSSEFVPPLDVPSLPTRPEAVKSAEEARRNPPIPPPPIPPPPQQQLPLFKSSAEAHRDKIGSSGHNKLGMSFQVESLGIRKGPGNLRVTQQPEDQAKGSSQHRKLVKPRNRKMGRTPDREMAEEDFEDEIM